MTRYRLLALDIDGTLVMTRDEISPPTRAALARARAAGVQIVLCTGRRYRRVLPIVAALGLDVPVVTASGALLKHPLDHRTLFRAEIPPADLAVLMRVVDAAGFEPVLYADTYHQGFDFYCRRDEAVTPELAEFFALNRDDLRIEPNLFAVPPAGVFAGFTMGGRSAMLDLADRLERALPERLYLHVLRSPRYQGFMCEIAPRGVDKWSGVLRLAREWGIGPHEICAVGDDVNDVPMIRGAGLGVAMGNAVPEAKAAADRVAPAHADDGLVAVVDWLMDAKF